MATSAPNPATLTQADYLGGIIGALQNEAKLETENSLIGFNNAVQYGPSPKPTSYKTYAVNVPLVTSLFNGTDTTESDWSNVIVATDYTPPPPPASPPPALPPGYPIGPQTKPGSGIYVALDVAPLAAFPDGTLLGPFTKRDNPTPFGDEPYWVGPAFIGGTN